MSQEQEKPETSVSLIDVLDAALMQKQQEEIDRGKSWGFPLRPSSSGKCARALAYELNEFEGHAKYPPDVKQPNIIRLLELGHDVERSIINVIRRSGPFDVRYAQQVVTFTRIPETGRLIEGSLDFLLIVGEHMKVLVDAKTKGIRYSQGYQSSWEEETAKYSKMSTLKQLGPDSYLAEDVEAFLDELRDETIYSNICQLNGYARTQFIVERGIEYASILQYNKSNSMLREIRFKTSQKLADLVNEKFLRVASAIYSGSGPESVPQERVLGSFACAFCRFKTECWPELDSKKEFFKTLPEKTWPRDTNRLGALGTQLEDLYEEYKKAADSKKALDRIEEDVVKLLVEHRGEFKKVRFADGAIFELKYLKSPKPHYELRRGKL